MGDAISHEPDLCCGKINTLDQSLRSPQSCLGRCQISSMLKNAPEKDAKNINPPSTRQIGKRTCSRAIDAVEH